MHKTFIIAEAGVNHNGDFETALRLVDAAKQAGADAVKFQLFSSQRLWGDDRIKHLELSADSMVVIYAYCKSVGIEFMCTPFGVEEVEALRLCVRRWKIASGCIRRQDLLEAVKKTGLPIIVSTGMSNERDIDELLEDLGGCEVTILHCTSSYPCKPEDANLMAIVSLSEFTFCPVGFSDHTSGINIAIAAVGIGAAVIEKHLTLDRGQEGPDHATSIEPLEFSAMCKAIREVELARGDGVKRVMDCEIPLRAAWRGN